jgi:hypothetical protein
MIYMKLLSKATNLIKKPQQLLEDKWNDCITEDDNYN